MYRYYHRERCVTKAYKYVFTCGYFKSIKTEWGTLYVLIVTKASLLMLIVVLLMKLELVTFTGNKCLAHVDEWRTICQRHSLHLKSQQVCIFLSLNCSRRYYLIFNNCAVPVLIGNVLCVCVPHAVTTERYPAETDKSNVDIDTSAV